jgi:hypothetical protein
MRPTQAEGVTALARADDEIAAGVGQEVILFDGMPLGTHFTGELIRCA